MTPLKLDFSPNAIVTWEEEVQAVRLRWKRLFLQLSEFEKISYAALDIISENNGKIWIADMFDSEGAFPQDVQQFIAETLISDGISRGLNMLLTVVPNQSGLASLSMKKWSNEVSNSNGFITAQFQTFENCSSWILEQKLNK